MTIDEYNERLEKMNPELNKIIDHFSQVKWTAYFVIMEMMGGESVRDDIMRLYNSCGDGDTNDTFMYRDLLIEYFEANTNKHDEWITALKFHML